MAILQFKGKHLIVPSSLSALSLSVSTLSPPSLQHVSPIRPSPLNHSVSNPLLRPTAI